MKSLADTDNLRLRTGYRLQWESHQDSWVLLYPEGMIQLNASAGIILNCFQQATTVAQVIARLEQQFPGAEIRNDIIEFVVDAHDQRWLQRSN